MSKTLISKKLETNTPPHCPGCSKILDGHTGERSLPTDGDISVCLYCAAVLQFQGKGMQLHLVLMPEDVKLDLKTNHPDTWSKLMEYVYHVKELI